MRLITHGAADMTFPINLQISGSLLFITGSSATARVEINVPLTASQFAIGSISLGSGTVAGDLIVNGALIANEFKTTVVSASITYRSGSTKQGDSLDDIHEVTGSLRVAGGISGSISGTFFGGGQGSFTGTEGLTGSLQKLVSGQSFLVAGPHVSITTQSNGQLLISATEVADVSASYVVIGATGSLPNERFLYAGTGVVLTDNGPGLGIGYSINDGVVATISGTRFTGPVNASGGLTGSLQRLSTGETYMVAGGGINITSQSNGQIVISSSQGTGASAWIDGNNKVKTTSSISISGGNTYADYVGSDVYFYVSGTVGIPSGSANARRISVLGGDVVISGSLSTNNNSVVINNNQIRYGSPGGSIEMGPGGDDDIFTFNRNNSAVFAAGVTAGGMLPLLALASNYGIKLGAIGIDSPASGEGETLRIFGSEAVSGKGGDVELMAGSGTNGPYGDIRMGADHGGETYALFGPSSGTMYTPLIASGGIDFFAPRWTDLQGQLHGTTGTGQADLTYEAYEDTSFRIYFMRHDQNDELHIQFQMPHSWDVNSTVYPHIHVIPAASAASPSNVRFETSYTWTPFNQQMSLSSSWTTGYVNFPVSGSMFRTHCVIELAAVAPATGSRASSLLFLKVRRLGDDPSDTYTTSKAYGTATANLGIFYADLHYQLCREGTVAKFDSTED